MAEDKNVCTSGTSKQLLYSEIFTDCLEEKLKVTGKKKQELALKKTFRPPPSSVLSKVRDFLPQLASANEKLKDLPPSDICIETTDEHDGPLIEMSLALVPGLPSDTEDSSEDSDNDSSGDSEVSEEKDNDAVTLSAGDQLQKKLKAGIEVLSDGDEDSVQAGDVP